MSALWRAHERETLALAPEPPTTPLEALAHVLTLLHDEPDAMRVITATSYVYPEAPWTGLTLGDLRRLLDDHARELAEEIRRQRNDKHDHVGCLPCFMYGEAADLIDPEAEER